MDACAVVEWQSVVRGRPNPLHFGIAARLKAAREGAALTGVRLSLDACLSRDTVLRIEDEGRVPQVDTVERLARVLGVSACHLAYGLPGEAGPVGDELACLGLGARLREARLSANFTRKGLARLAEITDTTIRGAEDGGRMLSVATGEALAKALGVSPCWLCYGQGPRELPPRVRRKPTTKTEAPRRVRAKG